MRTSRLFRGSQADHTQGSLDRLLIRFEIHGDFGQVESAGSNHINIGSGPADLVDQSFGGEVGHTDTQGIAIRFRGQVADKELAYPGTGWFLNTGTADNIGVHAGPADVLTHFVDDKKIDLIERKPAEPGFGLVKSSFSVS